MFLKGKELWGHINESSEAPGDAKDLSTWDTKDARIISWILGSMETHMLNNLRSFTTIKKMWEYSKRIYYQDNNTQQSQLQLEVANYTKGNLTIGQCYSYFQNLMSEYSGIIHAKLPATVLSGLQKVGNTINFL